VYALGTLETEVDSFDSGMGALIQHLGWQSTASDTLIWEVDKEEALDVN